MNPDARFVIACPACQGRIAAFVGSAGRTGCCPLCSTTLVVPAAASAPAAAGDAFVGLDAAPPVRAATADSSLAFRDPVRTVVAGDRAVELRRLSDEERRSRRARRNLLLLLVGGALLIALTVAFGSRPGR